MADKIEAKKYIQHRLGDDYVIPLVDTWDDPNEIDFLKLPPKYVLKCNHNSGRGMYIHRGSTIDEDQIRLNLKEALKYNYFYESREWAYKNIRPKIFCEQLIENTNADPLVDYKFYCYGGEPRYFMYSIGEASGHAKNHKFDVECRSIDERFKKKPTIPADEIELPHNIDKMIETVRSLCEGFPFIRVDLYNVDGHIYFGEFTFYSGGGFFKICDEAYKQQLADYIDLRKIQGVKG